jgi:segregation and condensation protein A
MESSRKHILSSVREQRTMPFDKIFEICRDRLQAIFLFLSMLELVQLNYMSILVGEGRNNFIVEFNPDRPEDPMDSGLFEEGGGERPDDGSDRPSDSGGLFPGYPGPSAN